MPDSISNNKRIAKNTLMLYLRMFLTMAVTLYTSRIVLKTLGVSDFGVYSVVGGFVSMLAYLNSVFVGSTQRFISFALGKKDEELICKTFATTRVIHIILAAIILILAESFGIWFVNHKLVIDPERIIAANWVFQCSLASLMITIISIPYNSCIVAHEHMDIYAYVSILEVVLKLVILYLLIVLPGDKLIVYALLHVGVSLIIRLCYTLYCRKHFFECKSKPSIDKPLFKKMFSYAGWTTLGNLGFSFKDQFSNMILNGFFGTTINAARGIAMQVSGAITSFASNFFMAMSPQIVKRYSAGEIEQSQNLVYAGTRISFYLLSFIVIPAVINIDYILKIWLDVVPNYTATFIKITLASSLIYSLTSSISTAIQATGNIRAFQIGVSVIMLSELPIAYLLLRLGYSAPYALLPAIFTNAVALAFRFWLVKRMIPSYSLKKYYLYGVARCVVIFILCYIICHYISKLLPTNFLWFCVDVVICILIIGTIIFVAGITKWERSVVINFVKSKIHLNF